MAPRWRLSCLICFSSAQITQNMNAKAGTNGMSSKMRWESIMSKFSGAASKRHDKSSHARLGTEGSASLLENSVRNKGTVNL